MTDVTHPQSRMTSQELSRGLDDSIVRAIECSLDIAGVEPSEDENKALNEAIDNFRAWLGAGAIFENRILFGGDATAHDFLSSLDWEIHCIWNDDRYGYVECRRMEATTREILVDLLEHGWAGPQTPPNDDHVVVKSETIGWNSRIPQERAERERQRLEKNTPSAGGSIRGMRL